MPALDRDPEPAHLKFRIVTGGGCLGTDLHAIITIDGKQYTYLWNRSHES